MLKRYIDSFTNNIFSFNLGAFTPISPKRPLSHQKNIDIRILRPKIDQNHLVSQITSSGGTTPPFCYRTIEDYNDNLDHLFNSG